MVFNGVHPLIHDWELQEKEREVNEKQRKLVKLLTELFHYFEDDPDLPKHDYFLEKIINTLEEY